MQIGWCTLATPFTRENGVGDDETSYAFDGYRVKKWNVQSSDYGEHWAVGDVIGTLIDFNMKEITFYRNDKSLGVAFKNIKIGPNMAYFPAIFMSENQQVEFNFGLRPFFYNSQKSLLDRYN
jgi:Kip1 ubiquitination-promoting complex protein 1